MTDAEAPIYIIGDVHGQLAKLTRLLRGAGLLDPDALWTGGPLWTGGRATLWLLGDFVDRGPSSLGVLDLVMRLQRDAAAAGGMVQGLLGNHEVQLLAAARFGDHPTGPDSTFREIWRRNGGSAAELAEIQPEHLAWMGALPAMAHAGDSLLVHADALFYTEYGDSVDAVNGALAAVLAGDDVPAWVRLVQQFVERRAFLRERVDGVAQAGRFLARYGGRVLIHGHTPISSITSQTPADVTAPLVYANGLCIDCDGAMWRGGQGFVYQVPTAARRSIHEGHDEHEDV